MSTATAPSTSTGDGTAHLPTKAELARPGLLVEVDRIKELLRLYLGIGSVAIPGGLDLAGPVDAVAARLGLSRFERDVLLLAAAVELDGEVAGLVSRCLGGEPHPTFALAMAVLPEQHWDALSPERPLRRWGLLTLAGTDPVAARPLAIDEHLLHTVAGLVDDSSTLDGLGVPRPVRGRLTATQAATVDELAAAAVGLGGPILVRLEGDDRDAQVAVAERFASRLGMVLLTVRDAALVETDLTRTAMMLDREAILADRLVLTSNERLLALLRPGSSWRSARRASRTGPCWPDGSTSPPVPSRSSSGRGRWGRTPIPTWRSRVARSRITTGSRPAASRRSPRSSRCWPEPVPTTCAGSPASGPGWGSGGSPS